MSLGAELKRRRLRDQKQRRRGALRSLAPATALGPLGTVRALGQLSRGIGADWDASIQRILKFDAEVLRLERVSFWSLSDEPPSIHCDAGYLAGGLAFERGTTLLETQAPESFRALREGRAIDVCDVRTDPRCRGMQEYFAARRILSLLVVPVWVDGRLAGFVCHEHSGSLRRWSAREEAFAEGMSQFVSSALAARAHTAVEAAARRAAFLDTVSLRLTSLDVHEIQRDAVALSVPTLGEASMLWVLGASGTLDCVALKHVDPSKEGAFLEAVAGIALQRETLTAFAVSQSQSLLIPEINPAALERYRVNPAERALVTRLGVRTAIVVPLTVAGKAFGAMSFVAAKRLYDADDLTLAENVVAHVSSALENARLYELSREALRARDDLLSLTAHELRTPLTALQLKMENLQRRSDAIRIDDIAPQVQRFGAIVCHVLEALKIRAEGVRPVLGPCDLATVVADRVRRVAPRAERSGSSITVASPSSVVGSWDQAQLETAVDVLLDNAIKFGAGRPIAVSLSADGSSTELSVHDGGIGIPRDRLGSIFQPFERAVPKENFGGLGLGLYIAKAIVDAHGGAIAVTSQPRHGSTFVVRLPLRR
jgi:signal transduction histidine kinase